MKYVRQKGSCDCGVAALAMITGLPYEEVLEPFRYHIDAGRGLHEHLFYDWLIRKGWAWQISYKIHHIGARNQKKDVWPPAPWAPGHLAQVQVPSNNYHFVAMDAVGRVLDPWDSARTSLDHPDFCDVTFVWGMWKVQPSDAS